jgi:predicted dehydrogenase
MVLRVGVVGCGNISEVYIRNAGRFPGLKVVACASRNGDSARDKAARHGLRAMSVNDLLAADDIDIVLNLTVPAAHAEISLAAIAAGKHVYSEKPLGVTVAEGSAILAAAEKAGIRVGCAPDTVLGPGIQFARRLIDEGATGEIVGGLSAVLSHGMEHWHPNPEFYYRHGSGPVLDLGPYHLAALTTLLGPVALVQATGRIGAAERTVTADGPLKGAAFRPEVLTTVNALLTFRSGAEVAFLASWDVWKHGLHPIELHGTKASLRVPDPDFFGGDVALSSGGEWRVFDTAAMPLGAINYAPPGSDRETLANYRGVGLADMAQAIETGRPHRASGAFALHALAVMEGILEAAATGRRVVIAVTAEGPAPFGAADLAELTGTSS